MTTTNITIDENWTQIVNGETPFLVTNTGATALQIAFSTGTPTVAIGHMIQPLCGFNNASFGTGEIWAKCGDGKSTTIAVSK